MNCEHDYVYEMDPNEAGWMCSLCKHRPGKPPGFSPVLDRQEVELKVDAVLWALDEAGVIHLSNSVMGEAVAGEVVAVCRKRDAFDQYSIAEFAMTLLAGQHRAHWQAVARGALAGDGGREDHEQS
jgi:hypothetical protein